MSNAVSVVVLAAGKGTRMRNNKRKVLHPLAGLPLIGHVLRAASSLEPDQTVIVLAPNMDDVFRSCLEWVPNAVLAVQEEPRGTGHAVQAAQPVLIDQGHVIVVFGDTPLITGTTLQALLDEARRSGAAVTVLGMRPPDPTGYGRLKLAEGELEAIVEHAHADDELKRSAACNSGVIVLDASRAKALLDDLPLVKGKGEYYLTDAVSCAHERGWACATIDGPWQEGMGVNSQDQLAEAYGLFQERARAALLASGVIMPAPETVHLSFDTKIVPGAVIEPFVVFGPGVVIDEAATILSHSHLEGARVGKEATVGPFARLRPGTVLDAGAKVGNFVETKKAVIGTGSKVNHLSYVGDATLGSNVNIGAGTITCNYDGFNKHQTVLGDHVFVGSNTALVAPVTVGDRATIGAGSTITMPVDADALSLARSKQVNKPGMAVRLRDRLRALKERLKGTG